jgi:dipeptidyl aminopeptidase/acylaminoacyl peptidase
LIYSYTDLSESPSGRGLRSDIYLTDLRGGSLQRLTSTPTQHDENAVFSPDGKKIAWTHPIGTGRKGMPGIDVEIYLMNADGTGETRLTYFSDPKSEYYDEHSKQMSEVHWSGRKSHRFRPCEPREAKGPQYGRERVDFDVRWRR